MMKMNNSVTGHAELNEEISKKSWCSLGRGIHQRDAPLIFVFAGVMFCLWLAVIADILWTMLGK